jgi:hypothetical protein
MDKNHGHSNQSTRQDFAAEMSEFEVGRGLSTDDTILNQQVYGKQFSPIPVRHDIPKDLLAHIQKLYDRTVPVLSRIFPTDPCLSWYGATDDDGYAKAKPHPTYKGSTRVHRYIWQSCYGDPIDTIDHACGLKSCINLRHLRELDLDHNRKFGDPRKLNTEKGN